MANGASEHVCPTCEQALSEVVVRITGVCPKHGIVPVVCGNPECWCAKDDPDPLVCTTCGSPAVFYQAMSGWSCLECGRDAPVSLTQATAPLSSPTCSYSASDSDSGGV